MTEIEQIEMTEAIEILGITQPTFYRWLREGRIQGSKVGRRWRFKREDVERLARGEAVIASVPNGTEQSLKDIHQQIQNLGFPLEERSADPISDLVIAMISLAMALDATDLHLEPDPKQSRLRFRIDGVLQEIMHMPPEVLDACVQQWKGRAHCNVQIKDLPQDGRIKIEHEGEQIIIRVTVVPTMIGESMTIRFLMEDRVTVDLDRIRFSQEHRQRIDNAINSPTGLIIVSGPSGSGKTTTLYSMLNELIKPEQKLMSIEDPVEYMIPGVNQIAVKEDTLPFSHAMRACMRSDPDVLMLGELRDKEIVTMVHQAALQGILVLTAMHTMDAVGVILRLRDIGIDSHLIADAIQLIVAQRLVRRLCPHCAQKVELDDTTREHMQTAAAIGGVDPLTLADNWHEAAGCEKCHGVGYQGRTVINETIEISRELRHAITNDANEEELQAAARTSGFSNLTVDAIRRAAAGETSLQELRRVSAL